MPIQSKQQPPYYQQYDQPTTPVILKLTTTLNHSQILTLPSLGYEIAPAPGTNKFYNLINAYIHSNTTAGAYTNVGANTVLQLYTGSSIETSTPTAANLLSDSFQNIAILQQTAILSEQSGYEAYTTQIKKYVPDTTNKELNLYALGNTGDFTGGNAANTLKLTIYYIIEEL